MVTTQKEVKHESVRIERIVSDLHGVIVDSKVGFLSLNMNSIKLPTLCTSIN